MSRFIYTEKVDMLNRVWRRVDGEWVRQFPPAKSPEDVLEDKRVMAVYESYVDDALRERLAQEALDWANLHAREGLGLSTPDEVHEFIEQEVEEVLRGR